MLYTLVLLTTWVLCGTTVLTSQPEVVLQQGRLKGLWMNSYGGRPYAAFLGIPYARPPVGKHRFKEPVAADSWLGVYNATKAGPKCLQLYYFYIREPFKMEGSEDCLYINVFTPRLNPNKAAGEKPLDVIAFIHGGALSVGSSLDMREDYLLGRDVVFVTFNYRLGPLGFLSTGDAAVPGNNGMKDQVLALKWIQQNIAAFGGDPNSVTIAGFSAGSASVHFHVLSPLSKGLFKSAIMVSGSALNMWALAENVREKSFTLARELGCPAEDSLSMIKCLRSRPAEHIVESSKLFLTWNYNPFAFFALTVEPPGPNAFLPDTPINLLKERKGSDVPLLISFTKEDGMFVALDIIRYPETTNEFKADWKRLMPHLFDFNYTVPCERKEEVGRAIIEHYKIDLDTKEGQKALVKAMTDRIMITDVSKSARLHSIINTSPVYLLKFSYTGKYSYSSLIGQEENWGVAHGEDLAFILPIDKYNTQEAGYSTQETESDRQVSRELIDLWVRLAANGTLDIEKVNQNLPKITFTDFQGPNQRVVTTVDELGEEAFWKSLNLNENIESAVPAHQEL